MLLTLVITPTPTAISTTAVLASSIVFRLALSEVVETAIARDLAFFITPTIGGRTATFIVTGVLTLPLDQPVGGPAHALIIFTTVTFGDAVIVTPTGSCIESTLLVARCVLNNGLVRDNDCKNTWVHRT